MNLLTKCSCGDLALKGLSQCPHCFAALLDAAGYLECYDVREVEQLFGRARKLQRGGLLDGITFQPTRKDGRVFRSDCMVLRLADLDSHVAKLGRVQAEREAALNAYRPLRFEPIETRKSTRRQTRERKETRL